MTAAYDTVMDLEERLSNKGVESPCTDQTHDLWNRRRDSYHIELIELVPHFIMDCNQAY